MTPLLLERWTALTPSRETPLAGGFWNAIPFNDTAKPQADMPALNEKWDYSKNLISGVNLGG